MYVGRRKPTRQDRFPTTVLELRFQHVETAVRLSLIALQCILVRRPVVVPEPVALAHHRPQAGQQEQDPLVEVDAVLLRVAAGPDPVLRVVHAQQVADHGARLPRHDARVGVLERGQPAVLVDGEEGRALDALGRVVAELPEAHVVGDGEDFERDGDLVGVRAGLVGVEDQRLESLSDGFHDVCEFEWF